MGLDRHIFFNLRLNWAYNMTLREGEMRLSQFFKIIILGLFLIGSTGCRQSIAERKVNDRLRGFKSKALTCLSTERVTRDEVEAFFMHQPTIPYWKHLQSAQKNANGIQKDATKFSRNDKVRHCFVGYRMSQRWSRSVGVFAGFYKEAQDVGDCKANTRFEVEDQVATIIGASYAKNGKHIRDCHQVNDVLARRTASFLENREKANKKRKEQLERLRTIMANIHNGP
jgi:hypothetical protein